MNRHRRTNVLAVFCALTSVFLILSGCGGGGGDGGVSPTPTPTPTPDIVTIVPLHTLGYDNVQAAVQGQPFARQLPAAGGNPPYTWRLVSGTLPSGLSLSDKGIISGTPTSTGAFTYTLRLTDSEGTWVDHSYTQNVGASGTISFVLQVSQIPEFGQNQHVGFIPFVQGGTLPWTFTITGLPNGVTFDPISGLIYGTPTNAYAGIITIILKDANGNQATGSPVTVPFPVNAPGAPAAPVNVTAAAGAGQVTISWSAVSGATSYNIYWSTTPGVTKTNGTKITGVTSPYTHTGRTNGTTYYYIVTAVNSFGESVESAQVPAMPTAGGTYSGGPISIQSDDQFTAANGVVSGSGTQADPYIIKGWTINTSSAPAISIYHTSKYFVIRDCRVENANQNGTGISLTLLSNGRVENSVVRNNYMGISLDGCSNVVLSNNAIDNCGKGISGGSYASYGVTISNNTITGCTEWGIDFFNFGNSSASGNTVDNNAYGIYMGSSFACTVSNNIVQGNKSTGIDVSYSGLVGGDNNTISYNDTSNNERGIVVYGSNNIISHNTSNGNKIAGIELDFIGLTNIAGSKNTVDNNTASYNGMQGLNVNHGCVNNTISNNTFLNNNALKKFTNGKPWYYDIEIWAFPNTNTLIGNTYGTIYFNNNPN